MRIRIQPVLLLVAALGLVAASCGGDDAGDDGGSDPTTTEGSTTTEESSSAPATSTTTGDSGKAIDGDLTFAVAEGYTATAIGEGVKPDLELAPDGTPGITYIHEDLDGFIDYADAASGWSPERVVDGYFYGPIGLAYTPDAQPRIAYHDHQDTSFNQDLGDLTYAVRSDEAWTIEAINDDGHDGWDSTIAIGPDTVVRAAGIDPEQFGSTVGVEYYELGDGGWTVTEIGSGAVAYEFNVSLAVDPDGNPALTYYDTTNAELKYATRTNSAWSIETVDAEGDAGRYSSLAFDSAGTPHISYLRLDGPTSGTVRYATLDGDAWTTGDIDTLDNLRTGFTGTRRNTAIALDADQTPHVVYSDESVVKRAIANAGAWEISPILTAGDQPLGQLVSFRLADDGTLHLATFEVTNESPLTGVVAYITES
jgi:hypothetical protein